jgi:hypothetical protein
MNMGNLLRIDFWQGSDRIHRYSPVALAIGLATPFDGLDKTPPEFNWGLGGELDEEGLPEFIKRMMPGVGQMLHGSRFLTTLRDGFIPFDTSAISICNPKDGFVRPERTRLPVGNFVNMHNLEVRSTGRFDVAEMAPGYVKAAFDFWPASRLRELLNDDPRFEGLRQHCSFLFDLDLNWDVDKGEIMQQILAGEQGQGIFDEMMFEVNFDGLREQLMANLLYRLRAQGGEQRKELAWLVPRLEDIRREELPFLSGLDRRAGLALNYIEPQ